RARARPRREAEARGGAVEPRRGRSLRLHRGDLRRVGARRSGEGRRDPAHRRHGAAAPRSAVARRGLRDGPLRRRPEARLPAGHGGAGARARRPGPALPRLPRRPRAARGAPVIELGDAQRRVLSGCAPLHPRAVPLADALGCVTSVDLRADEAVPPFANTAMDGYAVRARDTAEAPVRLDVTGTLAAGADAAAFTVGAGKAVRIMTGAPMPAGADAVVMVELTRAEDDGR